MKRQNWMMVVVAMVLLTGICVSARAEGTAQNWSATLSFSTDNNADLLPVSIGESTAASQLLKPPPLPGLAETGETADAVVNAYILKATSKAARDVYTVDSAAPGRAWVVNVDTEQEGVTVYVTPNLASFYSVYNLFIFDPVTGTRTDLRDQSGKKVAAFTSDATGSRTLFLVAGDSGTIAVSSGTGLMGVAMVNGVDKMPEGAKVYLDGSNTAADEVDANGQFSIAGLTTGNHTIKVKMDGKLSTAGTVSVTGSGYGTPVVIGDMYAGDVCCAGAEGMEGDNLIDSDDYTAWKDYFGLASTGTTCKTVDSRQVCYSTTYDLDGSGVIDSDDFMVFKEGFGKKGAD